MEVSGIIPKVIEIGSAKSGSETIYGPTCGFGSLLLKRTLLLRRSL